MDRVVHTCYVVVCYLAAAGIGDPKWNKYRNKNYGRHDFQIDLGMALLNYAISISWDGVSKRPNWMRQGEFIPCDCGECFFCINGHTTGIAHKSRKKQKKEVFFANGEVLTTDKCTDVRVKL